jgi:CheY-like chemotaxis protein
VAIKTEERVLVVEDDALMRQLETEILRDAGYRVDEANGGQAAIDLLGRFRPDLVLLDIVMPGVNGWDVLRSIATLPSPPPVIVASGLIEAVPPAPLSALVVGSLSKPFRVDALLAMCREALAVPVVQPASGARREARRTFVVEATLLSAAGAPLVTGRLVQVSRRGFRIDLAAILAAGDPALISFRVPGRDQPLELRGRVCWSDGRTTGVEIDGLTPSEARVLGEFVGVETTAEEAVPSHSPETRSAVRLLA